MRSSDIRDRLCETAVRVRNSGEWGELAEVLVDAAAEIERLRFAIRRIGEQDGTLSVCEGNVTVTVDVTLTDEERKAIEELMVLAVESRPNSDRIRRLSHTVAAFLRKSK